MSLRNSDRNLFPLHGDCARRLQLGIYKRFSNGTSVSALLNHNSEGQRHQVESLGIPDSFGISSCGRYGGLEGLPSWLKT